RLGGGLFPAPRWQLDLERRQLCGGRRRPTAYRRALGRDLREEWKRHRVDERYVDLERRHAQALRRPDHAERATDQQLRRHHLQQQQAHHLGRRQHHRHPTRLRWHAIRERRRCTCREDRRDWNGEHFH